MNNYTYKNAKKCNDDKINKRKSLNCEDTIEQFDTILRMELMNLINESCSEEEKREKYKELKPSIMAFQRQKEQLNSNLVYQKLTNNSESVSQINSTNKESKYSQEKLLLAYEKQSIFSEDMDDSENETNQEVEKRGDGFFTKILDCLKNKKTTEVVQAQLETEILEKSEEVEEEETFVSSEEYQDNEENAEIYNEFEKQLRNFQNYSRENKSYRYNRNGRNIGGSKGFSR